MHIQIGGDKARFQRVHGDIVASYSYVNDERAMILWPLRRRSDHAGAFVVCDSAAWRYNPDQPRKDWLEADGRPFCGPPYIMMQAGVAAAQMGMDTTRATIIRIASVIAEGLEDLVRLAPQRPDDEARKPIGEASLIVEGKEVVTGEI